MRSESAVSNQENRRGRAESKKSSTVDTWQAIQAPSKEEAAANITEELFGDALSKLAHLMDKDKKKLQRLLRKRHGRQT